MEVMVARARLGGDGTDWSRSDATTEEEITAQIAEDNAEAYARRRRLCPACPRQGRPVLGVALARPRQTHRRPKLRSNFER